MIQDFITRKFGKAKYLPKSSFLCGFSLMMQSWLETIWWKGNGLGILVVYSVILLKVSIICFFNAQLQKLFGQFVAKCFGATNIPCNLQQCWKWCEYWLPHGENYYLWGIAAICWASWKNRNKACFEKHLIKDPLEIICHACALVKYWAGLFPSIDKEKLEEGAATMLRLAKELLASQRKNREEGRRLDSRDQNEDDDEPVWSYLHFWGTRQMLSVCVKRSFWHCIIRLQMICSFPHMYGWKNSVKPARCSSAWASPALSVWCLSP